ncbi:hypothetical protein Suden_0048 [Sulfurimonas denitrificans DSM 1251]|jgi:hypothetical protein|uniref:DUF309 domain-containing protein n=1 Tax=Sulfurimonas denitrificans (strain ATCC 33889 / DSM 1251) TaxID=326298 RepID=Q30UK2_SULDN|nr:DUF309 domain-containing protein [Sulfurimonas denitrificans]ABB43329.1 hypothetical protein Suden_0048 [Sulfurimonas denitrificans DSM 1251]MDD3442319.1 DUF309 domain-containing protein [Sulfurimonas denitrificans]
MSEHKKQLDSFIENLKNKNFYDAHEDIELLWFKRRFEDSDEIKLLKGFINASVSFELYKKGKVEASKKVWQTYLKYRELIHKIDSPHLYMYNLIIEEIQSIKEAQDKIG